MAVPPSVNLAAEDSVAAETRPHLPRPLLHLPSLGRQGGSGLNGTKARRVRAFIGIHSRGSWPGEKLSVASPRRSSPTSLPSEVVIGTLPTSRSVITRAISLMAT